MPFSIINDDTYFKFAMQIKYFFKEEIMKIFGL